MRHELSWRFLLQQKDGYGDDIQTGRKVVFSIYRYKTRYKHYKILEKSKGSI